MKKKYILTILFIFSALESHALPFNSNLSKYEETYLRANGTVIKNLEGAEDLCIRNFNPEFDARIQKIKNSKPQYIVEVMQIRKIEESENPIESFYSILQNIRLYQQIPFRYNDDGTVASYLYSKATKISDKTDGSYRFINADLTLPPFKSCKFEITIRHENELIVYSAENTVDLTCMGFIRIKKGSMNSIITAFKSDGYWIIYGIGALNAPKVPILLKAINGAFIARVECFCNWATNYIDEREKNARPKLPPYTVQYWDKK